MNCEKCGSVIEVGQLVCSNCGAAVAEPQVAPVQEQSGAWQEKMSKKEFYKHPNLNSVRKEINSCGIVLYILAALNLVISLLSGSAGILDAVLLIGLGLGIQLGKSRACAVILTVYSIINIIVLLVSTGSFGGYLIAIAGVYSVINTFKFHKLYKEYCATGIVPVLPEKGKKK